VPVSADYQNFSLNNASTWTVKGWQTAFPDQIPAEKALGMPNIRKGYDIPIKTRNKKCRSDQFGQFQDTPPFPQLMKVVPPPTLYGRGSGKNDAIVMGEIHMPFSGMLDHAGHNLYKPTYHPQKALFHRPEDV
jgi:hypothetical protein